MPLAAVHALEPHRGGDFAVEFAAEVERHVEIAELADRQRQPHFDLVGAVKHGHILGAVGVLAEFDLPRLHNRVERCAQFGALEIEPGLPELGFDFADARGGDIGEALRILDLRFAGEAALAEFAQALEFGAGVGLLGDHLLECRLAAGQGDFIIAGFEPQQRVTLGGVASGFELGRDPVHGSRHRR